jgi:hypothetical protein
MRSLARTSTSFGILAWSIRRQVPSSQPSTEGTSEWDLSPGAVFRSRVLYSDDVIDGALPDQLIVGEGQSFDCHAQSTTSLRLKKHATCEQRASKNRRAIKHRERCWIAADVYGKQT